MNLINRNWLLKIYKPAMWSTQDGLTTVQANQYDPTTHYNESYVTLKDEATGQTTLSYHRIRLYTPDEVISLFQKNGLTHIKTYGDFSGRELESENSSHPVFIAAKNE